MKKIRTITVFLTGALLAFALGACSAIESITDPTEAVSSTTSDIETDFNETKQVDESLAVPTFSTDLYYTTNVAQESTLTLDGTAVCDDGGEITYQWYSSNIESNGGGTVIDGATDAVYTVDTSEIGSTFYYVVAYNNHGDSYNMAVSSVNKVVVFSRGEWATDEFGGTRYMGEDGTYPVSTWAVIDNATYLFDENGYRAQGWRVDGTTAMYFGEDGVYQYSQEVAEGTTIGEDGSLIEPVTDAAAPVEEVTQTETPAETDAGTQTVDAGTTDAAPAE